MSPTIDSGLPYKNWALIFLSIISLSPMNATSKPRLLKNPTWSLAIELKGETTKTSRNVGMIKPLSSYTLKTLGKIWKVKLVPKPVGRAGNTSFFRTTCSTINLSSGFKFRTSGKYFRLSKIASLMSSLVKNNASHFQQLLPANNATHESLRKLCESIGNSHPYTWMNLAPTYRMQLGKFSFWYPDESILTTLFMMKDR